MIGNYSCFLFSFSVETRGPVTSVQPFHRVYPSGISGIYVIKMALHHIRIQRWPQFILIENNEVMIRSDNDQATKIRTIYQNRDTETIENERIFPIEQL